MQHWDIYTVGSVVSGILLLVVSFLPGLKATQRFWVFASGIAIGGYGIYVANQTSGTYAFPVQIFVIPVVALAAVVLAAVKAWSRPGATHRPDQTER
jgi:hypothetical protein